jgi:hypothetical protein
VYLENLKDPSTKHVVELIKAAIRSLDVPQDQ